MTIYRSFLFALFTLTAACAEEPASSEHGSTAAPTNAEECKDLGGRIVPDPGDGSAACAEGEEDLGRIRWGIEGARCCL